MLCTRDVLLLDLPLVLSLTAFRFLFKSPLLSLMIQILINSSQSPPLLLILLYLSSLQ